MLQFCRLTNEYNDPSPQSVLGPRSLVTMDRNLLFYCSDRWPLSQGSLHYTTNILQQVFCFRKSSNFAFSFWFLQDERKEAKENNQSLTLSVDLWYHRLSCHILNIFITPQNHWNDSLVGQLKFKFAITDWLKFLILISIKKTARHNQWSEKINSIWRFGKDSR